MSFITDHKQKFDDLKKKLITKDGLFKDNRLIEGKSYIYDDNGILQRISIYKNGFYVGLLVLFINLIKFFKLSSFGCKCLYHDHSG